MKRALLILLTATFFVSILTASPITESEEYKKMMEFKSLYNTAYEEGNYEKALEYAKEVKRYSDLVLEMMNAPPETETDTAELEQIQKEIMEALKAKLQDLKNLGADIIIPEDYDYFVVETDKFQGMPDSPDSIDATREESDNLLNQMTETEQALIANLNYLESLLALAEQDLYNAEQAEGYYYAEEEIKQGADKYFEGDKAFKNLNLVDAEKALLESRFYSLEALRISLILKQRGDLDKLLKENQDLLVKYSRVVKRNEKGLLRWSEAWTGYEPFLEENPLVEWGPVERNMYNANVTSGLLPVPQPMMAEADMSDDEMSTATSEETTDLFATAVQLWENGVKARNNQEIELATDYFNQSISFINQYRESIKPEKYNVFEKGSKADSLWLISLEIYGSAFLWPLIFEENSDTISDPWKIWPQQELMIPTP